MEKSMTEKKEESFNGELLTDPQEIKIMEIFKSLDDEGKKNAIQLANDIVIGKIKV